MKPGRFKFAVGFTAATLFALGCAQNSVPHERTSPRETGSALQKEKRTPSRAQWADGHVTPQGSSADSLCVKLTDSAGNDRRIPVRAGAHMRLSFRHSIYGSQVDEVFSLLPGGFRLIQLRYSEARLVEFYGHESAPMENGVWIVAPAPAFFSSLNLDLSPDGAMSLYIDQGPHRRRLSLPVGGALRLSAATCEPSAHG
jgi:hypothetical protein